MSAQAVSLKVNATTPVDCKFWMEDDGWNGQCERFALYVRASSFEEAKKKMESALGTHIATILEHTTKIKASNEQAA